MRVFDYIEDENGKKKPVLNKKETAIAQDRQELIKQKFAEWIWKNIDRRELLCRIYNETFNGVRPRAFYFVTESIIRAWFMMNLFKDIIPASVCGKV